MSGTPTSADVRPAVAVLPLSDPGSRPEQRYFTDGVTEDIIVELSRFHDIQVIAPSSSFACEHLAGDAGRIAQALDVGYVVEGGIRRAEGRLRITAHLVEARNGSRVWTDRYDEPEGNLFELQGRISARIVASLVPEIFHAEQHRVGRQPACDPQAYELALMACARIDQATAAVDAPALQAGIALAEEAAALDPLCQRAQHAIALGYCRRAAPGFVGLATEEDLAHAQAAALRLRELDESNHAAYALLGHIAMRRLQHDRALTNLRRAHELNPSDVTALRWLSWVESNFGLAADAREHAELALRLSPRDRTVDLGYWILALACYVGRDYPTCVAQLRHSIALNPQYTGRRTLLAACLAEMGDLDGAAEVVAGLAQRAPGLIRGHLSGPTPFADASLATRFQAALLLADRPAEAPPEHGAADHGAADHGAAETPPVGLLTERECQVLRGVAAGGSNGEIAARLGVSEHTVKRHLANILSKLKLHTRAAAVAAAARGGLL